MSVKLSKKTETVYVARCQWAVGQDTEGRDIVPFGLLWERKSYDDAASIVDRHGVETYAPKWDVIARRYHTWLEQITRYDDGTEESVIVREYNCPAEPVKTRKSVPAVLAEHENHRVYVSGAGASDVVTVDTVNSTPDKLRWQFQGYAVYCLRCTASLSEQWGV